MGDTGASVSYRRLRTHGSGNIPALFTKLYLIMISLRASPNLPQAHNLGHVEVINKGPVAHHKTPPSAPILSRPTQATLHSIRLYP